jgi:hypothetical protein
LETTAISHFRRASFGEIIEIIFERLSVDLRYRANPNLSSARKVEGGRLRLTAALNLDWFEAARFSA